MEYCKRINFGYVALIGFLELGYCT